MNSSTLKPVRFLPFVLTVSSGLACGGLVASAIGCSGESEPGSPHNVGEQSTERASSLTKPIPYGNTIQSFGDVGNGVLDIDANLFIGHSTEQDSAINKPFSYADKTVEYYDWRHEFRKSATNVDASDTVHIFLVLEDVPFAWGELNNSAITEESRTWVIEQRKNQTAALTRSLAKKLQNIGATKIGEFWIAPMVSAVVEAKYISEISYWPELKNGSVDTVNAEWDAPYDGIQLRNGTLTQNLRSVGYLGESGGRTGGAVKLAIYDSNSFLNTHPAFQKSSGGLRISTYSCAASTNSCSPAVLTNSTGHGVAVTSFLTASIEAGQDPNFPGVGTTEQLKRSGVSAFSQVRYYAAANGEGIMSTMNTALSNAVANGIDIFVSTSNFGECPNTSNCCNKNYDPGNFSTTVQNAADAGLLFLKSMGNQNAATCRATYPATRKQILAVGALNTVDSSIPYGSIPISGVSSRGGMSITTSTGVSSLFAVADIAAPGASLYIADGPSSLPQNGYTVWDPSIFTNGFTSYATPNAAGAAALFRNAWISNGRTFYHGFEFLTNMLLMGDGWSSEYNSELLVTFDKWSGAGRLRMHYPHAVDLGANWSWQSVSTVFTNDGDFLLYHPFGNGVPAPSSITQFKAAMTFEESDYSYAGDMDLFLQDTCPPGGGVVDIEYDRGYDVRSRLQSTNVAGKCLRVKVLAFKTAGVPRKVFVASYAHSSNTANH